MNPSDLAGSVAAVYDFAADHIETYGWTQSRSFDRTAGLPIEQSPACLTGAMGRMPGRAYNIAIYVLQAELGGYIIDWNDTPGRERWEVVELLRTMAKRARAGDLNLT